MSGRIIAFFRASPPKAGGEFDEQRFRSVRWQTFITMTLAYVTFYVCRLSFTVAKSALVELGITPTELGMIGSTLFFSYAIGKLVNGFIADHANVVRYMSLGLLLSAGMTLMMGMTSNAMLLAIFWGINGWAQSMGVGPCVVSLARWYGCKERGTFYAIWSTAHNIGEAMTYMVIAAVIAGFGWQMGYLSTAALGAAGVVLMLLFMRDSPQSCGFPSINVIRDEPLEETEARGSVFKNQLLALRNPALWALALASAFLYIDRYAVNSWGIFFLEQDKAYSTLEASGIIGVNAIAGIAGTIIAGMLSDRFFPRNRRPSTGIGEAVARILLVSAWPFHSSRLWPLSSCLSIHGIKLPASGTPKLSTARSPLRVSAVTLRSISRMADAGFASSVATWLCSWPIWVSSSRM